MLELNFYTTESSKQVSTEFNLLKAVKNYSPIKCFNDYNYKFVCVLKHAHLKGIHLNLN